MAHRTKQVRTEHSFSLDQVASVLEKMNRNGPLLLVDVVGVYGTQDGM